MVLVSPCFIFTEYRCGLLSLLTLTSCLSPKLNTMKLETTNLGKLGVTRLNRAWQVSGLILYRDWFVSALSFYSFLPKFFYGVIQVI